MTTPLSDQGFGISALADAYRRRRLRVADMVEMLIERLAARGEEHVWISRVEAPALRARAAALDALDPAAAARLPLFGVPFSVKDNIDAAGLDTTAGCPAYAYRPAADAPAVARILAAGAVLVGKTNLDQFATGLVGVRSPYGVPRNPFDPAYIPGGSSSGSGVSVATGLCGFSLATDTAGSGRVPAALLGIVGLKPSRGLVSTRGVVPACRSLDCVSVLAGSVSDAEAVFAVIAGFDDQDPFARRDRTQAAPLAAGFRFGIPAVADFVDGGDPATRPLFEAAVAALEGLGGVAVEVPFAPFREAASLLYDGPWVAERMAGVGDFVAAHPEAVHPVTRGIIESAGRFTAAEGFRAAYRLAELRRRTERCFDDIDLLLVPSVPTTYRVAEVLADPLRLNMVLGSYTNFVNLLDLAALAIPAGSRPDGLPFGITLIGPALSDRRLAALGRRLTEREGPLPLPSAPPGRVVFAVLGAHLSGMALNGELRALGGELVGAVRTAPCYRMYLIDGPVPRPGLLRVPAGDGGAAVEAELWSLPDAGFGRFVAEIGPPLGIGTLMLEDGRQVKGFLCESAAIAMARDITVHGGWRRFMAEERAEG